MHVPAPPLPAPMALEPAAPLGGDGVRAALQRARDELAGMRPAQLSDGSWFQVVLQRSARRHLRRQAADDAVSAWRRSHPELDDAALVDRIIRRTARRAAFVGGTSGALITAAELAAIGTLGSSISAAFLLVLAELAVIERVQARMIFTVSALHGHRMSPDDLHDVGLLYGNVLKVKGATRAAAWARDGAVALFRLVGLRFMRRAFVRYSVPVLSIGLGGGMNYLMTRSLGRHAHRRFEHKAHTDSRLARLDAQEDALRRLLLALMGLMAAADGRIDRRERDLLRRTLDRLAVDGTPREELLAAMSAPEETLYASLEALGDDDEFRDVVLELLALMAVSDGELVPAEIALLDRLSAVCGFRFDEAELRARYASFLEGR